MAPPSSSPPTLPIANANNKTALATVSNMNKKKPAPSLLNSNLDMVTIIVKGNDPGDKKKECFKTLEFRMHKTFVCYYSKMLDKAFNGPYIEGQTQSITLEDLKFPQTFGVIQNWIYTQRIDVVEMKSVLGGSTSEKLHRLWIFAGYLIMPKLQNAIMSALSKEELVPGHLTNYIYSNTTPESKLRKYFARELAEVLFELDFDFLGETVPTEVMRDVCRYMRLHSREQLTPFNINEYLVNVNDD